MNKEKNVMLFEEYFANKAMIAEGKKYSAEKEEKEDELTEDEISDLSDVEDLIDAKKFALAAKTLKNLEKENKGICKNAKFIKLKKAVDKKQVA